MFCCFAILSLSNCCATLNSASISCAFRKWSASAFAKSEWNCFSSSASLALQQIHKYNIHNAENNLFQWHLQVKNWRILSLPMAKIRQRHSMGDRKTQILPFFRHLHFVVLPVGSTQTKLDVSAKLPTFPYPKVSKSFLYSDVFMAKSCAQIPSFKSMTFKQRQKAEHFFGHPALDNSAITVFSRPLMTYIILFIDKLIKTVTECI